MPQTVPEPYRIALIGCGRVGVWLEDDPLRVKPATHMGGIRKIIETGSVKKGLLLTAVCDIDQKRMKECCERWKVPQAYSDYQELITCEKPDIVIIATWTASHRDIAVFAAKNGVKGIVLEKPVAVTLEQARQVIGTCKMYGVKLVINHERRWDPLFRKARDIVSENRLGPLKTIYGNVFSRSAPRGGWQETLPETGGGPLMHDGTHLVDMVRYFAGDIDTVCGHVIREDPEVGSETTATAMMRTRNGVNVFVEAGGMRDYFNFEMDLQLELGRITIGNGIKKYQVTETSRRYTGFKDLVSEPFPEFARDSDPFTGAILDVISAIETGSQPDSSGEDGLKAMEAIFAVYYSAYLGNKPVTLPLEISGHPLEKMFRTGLL